MTFTWRAPEWKWVSTDNNQGLTRFCTYTCFISLCLLQWSVRSMYFLLYHFKHCFHTKVLSLQTTAKHEGRASKIENGTTGITKSSQQHKNPANKQDNVKIKGLQANVSIPKVCNFPYLRLSIVIRYMRFQTWYLLQQR